MYRNLVHSRYRHLGSSELLRIPVRALLGIGSDAETCLHSLQIETIFDLALSRIFSAAHELVQAADEPAHPFHTGARIAPDRIDGRGSRLTVEEVIDAPIEILEGIGSSLGATLRSTMHVETVADLAAWPPFQAACAILRATEGRVTAPEDLESPADLVPTNGRYPTDKRNFTNIVLRSIGYSGESTDIASAPSLDLADLEKKAVTLGIGYGAIITWEQAWYGQGLALGSLLHSLALAPGESTAIAVIDWNRTSSASSSEEIDQQESLSNEVSHNRALEEVVSGVVNELQEGFSNTTSKGKTRGIGVSTGGAFSYGAGAWSAGGGSGLSGGVSSTEGTSTTVTRTTGTRETFANFAQKIAESTQQNASSARSRRASVVQEVKERETETLTTRIVTNYNHMHALSVCYYEVVQAFRVVLRPVRAERCLFLPIKPLDFSDDTTLERFRGSILAVTRDPLVARVLQDRLESVIHCNVKGASYARYSARIGRPVDMPGPLLVSSGARITHLSASTSRPPEPLTIRVYSTEDRRVTIVQDTAEEVDFAVSDLAALVVPGAPRLGSGTVSLVLDVTDSGGTSRYRITYPVDFAERGEGFDVSFITHRVGGSDLAEVKARLRTDAAWYTSRIWETLDSSTISSMLSGFSLEGRPLIERIDPTVIATIGTHVCFRMVLSDDDQRAWQEELTQWGLLDASSIRADTIPLATGGVFAEAVLGRFNSAEKLDMTRFWNWKDSPPPFAAPSIAPLQAGQHSGTAAPSAGSLDSPIVNIVNPGALPYSNGLGAALQTLGSANVFRDMSYAGTNASALNHALGAAAETQQAMVATAQAAFNTAAQLASPSEKGALLNAARDNQNAARYLPTTPGDASPSPAPAAAPAAASTTPGSPDGSTAPSSSSGGSGAGAAGSAGKGAARPASGDAPAIGDRAEARPAGTAAVDQTPQQQVQVRLRMVVPASGARVDIIEFLSDKTPDSIVKFLKLLRGLFADEVKITGKQASAIVTALAVLEGGPAAAEEASKIGSVLGELVELVPTPGETVTFIMDRIKMIAELIVQMGRVLSNVIFPTLSGDEWGSIVQELSVDPSRASPALSAARVNVDTIRYFLLEDAEPVSSGPWWAVDTSDSVTLYQDSPSEAKLGASVVRTARGADVTFNVRREMLLAWGQLVARAIVAGQRKFLVLHARMVGELHGIISELGDAAAGPLGSWIKQPIAELGEWISKAGTVYSNAVKTVSDAIEFIATPVVDGRITVSLERDVSAWQAHVSGEHDKFPRFEVSLGLVGATLKEETLLYQSRIDGAGPVGMILPQDVVNRHLSLDKSLLTP